VASPYGTQYRVKCLKVDQTEEYSDWFNSHEEARKALRRIAAISTLCLSKTSSRPVSLASPTWPSPSGPALPDRERLLREWTGCSNRLMKLQSEEFAVIRTTSSVSASFAVRIRVSKAADIKWAARTINTRLSTSVSEDLELAETDATGAWE
jgi:hypothetical protein